MTSSASIERSRARLASVLAGATLLFAAANPCFAQQAEPPAEPPEASPPAPVARAAPPAAEPTDRIGRIEQQITDLQTMVAALESLVKQRPDAQLPQESPAGEAGPVAGMSARIDALETQVGALSSQLELMTQQLGALDAKLNGGAEPQPLQPPPGEEPQPLPEERPGRQGLLTAGPAYAAAEGPRDTVCAGGGLHKSGC